jgi:hypothetical protein
MNAANRLLLPLLVAVLVPGVFAQAQWMPPQVEQGLAQQLAGRLASIESGDRAAALERARQAVKAMGALLGSWSDAVVISRAPKFSQLAMPVTNEPALGAMAAYQMCTMAQFLRVESGKDDGNRRATVVGLTATTMAVLRLRPPFLAAGGSMDRVEAFLTSDEMAALLDAIRQKPALLAHVEEQCRPVVGELVGKAGGPAS